MIDLTPQQIKDNAPLTATHYKALLSGFAYLRRLNGLWWRRVEGGWVECCLQHQFEKQLQGGLIKPL